MTSKRKAKIAQVHLVDVSFMKEIVYLKSHRDNGFVSHLHRNTKDNVDKNVTGHTQLKVSAHYHFKKNPLM